MAASLHMFKHRLSDELPLNPHERNDDVATAVT